MLKHLTAIAAPANPNEPIRSLKRGNTPIHNL